MLVSRLLSYGRGQAPCRPNTSQHCGQGQPGCDPLPGIPSSPLQPASRRSDAYCLFQWAPCRRHDSVSASGEGTSTTLLLWLPQECKHAGWQGWPEAAGAWEASCQLSRHAAAVPHSITLRVALLLRRWRLWTRRTRCSTKSLRRWGGPGACSPDSSPGNAWPGSSGPAGRPRQAGALWRRCPSALPPAALQ